MNNLFDPDTALGSAFNTIFSDNNASQSKNHFPRPRCDTTAAGRKRRSRSSRQTTNRMRRDGAYEWEPIVSMENLQVSLDNGVTWVIAKNIRVIVSDSDVADEEVHLDITSEGIKTDVVCEHKVLGTDTKYFFDIIRTLD